VAHRARFRWKGCAPGSPAHSAGSRGPGETGYGFPTNKLQCDLIETWGNAAPKGGPNPEEEFSLLPTVDHTDPASPDLEFEICSWLVNDSKGNLSALEYVDYCGRVVEHAKV